MEDIHLAKGIHRYHIIYIYIYINGNRLSRERNIIAGKQDLSALKYYGEAHHLINAMISINPKMRPSTSMVLSHIFFWDSEKKLNYIIDLSDRIEFETTSN